MYGLNRSMRCVATMHDYSDVNCLIPCILCIIYIDQYVVLPENHCFVDLLFILGTVFVLEFDPFTG